MVAPGNSGRRIAVEKLTHKETVRRLVEKTGVTEEQAAKAIEVWWEIIAQNYMPGRGIRILNPETGESFDVTPEEHLGKVIRLHSQAGCGIIQEEGIEGGQYGFTFDKLNGYRGESSHELTKFSPQGLRIGTVVKFIVDDTQKLLGVYPLIFKA